MIRIRGPVAAAGEEDGAADFLARSTATRAEALPGRQSRPPADLAERDSAVRESPARLDEEPDLVAPGGRGRRKQLLWP
ncbi:hypothetical protein [Streptomyces hokutonensis]|uniref:hypothetical protein n=1 Tax=Streptomyces hokutonensis TaxID=1306990 RepID=UPI0038279ACA